MASVEELSEHVAGLLQMSYTVTDNEILQNTQDQLNEAAQSEYYTEALILISKNTEKIDSIRSSALIAIGHQISTGWEKLGEEITQNLIESVKQYLISYTPKIKGEVFDVCTKIIRNSIKFGQYNQVASEIAGLFTSENVKLALDMAICMTSGFVGCTSNEIPKEEIEQLTAEILPHVIQLFSATDDSEVLSSAYDIITNCLKLSGCTYFNQNDNFGEVGPMINGFMLMEGMNDIQSNINFLISSANFLFNLLQRYRSLFDGEVIQAVFNTICNCVSTGKMPAQVRATLFGILHILCNFDEFYDAIVSPSKDVFFPDVMIPQFFLTQTDVQNASEDPRTFIGENHKSTGDYNDVKETACMIIQKLGSNNETALVDIYEMFREIIGTFGSSDQGISSQNLLWAGAHMFSCIAEEFTSRFKTQMLQFISEIFELAGSESELVRASVFLIMSKMKSGVPLSITTACLERIDDPSLLVQYYAFGAASNFIDKMSLDSEVEECVEAFADSIDTIFEAVLNISEAFSEPGLASTLSALIRAFDDQMLPHVGDVAVELIRQIAAVGQSPDDEEAFAESIKLNQTLAEIVELVMARAPESIAELNSALIKQSIEALGSITNFDVADPFLETIFQMLESYNGPFDEEMWGLASVIAPFFSQAGDVSIAAAVSILCILLVRDSEFPSREGVAPEIVSFCVEQMTIRMEYPDSWNELAKLAEGLLVRVPADSPLLSEAFPQFCEMAMVMKRTINTMYNDIFGIALLFNGLLLNNFARTVETLGPDFPEFMEFWRETVIFPESVLVMMQNFEAFGGEQYAVLSAIVNMLMSDILAKSEEAGDEFDQDVDADGVVWYDFGDTLNAFHEFFTGVSQNNSELMSQLQEEFDEDLEIMNNAQAVAAKYIEMRDSKK